MEKSNSPTTGDGPSLIPVVSSRPIQTPMLKVNLTIQADSPAVNSKPSNLSSNKPTTSSGTTQPSISLNKTKYFAPTLQPTGGINEIDAIGTGIENSGEKGSSYSQQSRGSGPLIIMTILGCAVAAFIILSVFTLSRRRRRDSLPFRTHDDESDHNSNSMSLMDSSSTMRKDFTPPEIGAHDDSSALFTDSPLAKSVSTQDSWEQGNCQREKFSFIEPPFFEPNVQDAIRQAPVQPRTSNSLYIDPEELRVPASSPYTRAMSSSPLKRPRPFSPKRLSLDTAVLYAPKGPLGLIMDSSPEGPVVHAVKEFSPMAGVLKPGDCIIAVDDEDTSSMDPASLAKLMMKKSKQEQRRLTVSQCRR